MNIRQYPTCEVGKILEDPLTASTVCLAFLLFLVLKPRLTYLGPTRLSWTCQRVPRNWACEVGLAPCVNQHSVYVCIHVSNVYVYLQLYTTAMRISVEILMPAGHTDKDKHIHMHIHLHLHIHEHSTQPCPDLNSRNVFSALCIIKVDDADQCIMHIHIHINVCIYICISMCVYTYAYINNASARRNTHASTARNLPWHCH